MTFAGIAECASISITNPEYVFNFSIGSSIHYITTVGCMEMVAAHGIGVTLPAKKAYQSDFSEAGDNEVQFSLKGKSSPCRYRAFRIQAGLSPASASEERSRDWVSGLTFNHKSNNKRVNEINLKCRRKEFNTVLSRESFFLFQCREATANEYNSYYSIDIDFTKDTTIAIETESSI
jgi:hypothetical protein